MLVWLSKVYSDDATASFGRLIATAAFACFIGLHIWIITNPWEFIKNVTFIPKVTDYLFYLTIGGYSVTTIKEIAHVIFAKSGSKVVMEDKDNG